MKFSIPPQWRTVRHKLLDQISSNETVVMILLAVAVGASTGFGIGIFRRVLDSVFDFTVINLGGTFPLLILILPAIGGLLTALWLRLAGRAGETGLGVSGIMEAVALHGGRVGLRGSIARVVGAVLTVGFGGSAGPEDPSVQIGATIGSQLAGKLHLSEARVKTLVGCGAAAGVSAAFNAPITGVFFAMEIVLGEFSGAALGWVVLAAVAGAVTSQTILGSAPAFNIPAYQLRSPAELLLYMLLGVLAAGVAVLYIFLLDRVETFFEHFRVPRWTKPAIGGLAVGLLAYFGSTAIMGPGYLSIQTVLQGSATGGALFLFSLVGLKIVATPLTIGSGGQGGLFAPSLFLGAMLGAGFGTVANSIFGSAIAPAPAYGLVGMGAVLAAAIHAPLTALMLPFEMTQDYHVILPLMFAVVISTVIGQLLQKESVYTLKLKQRGVELRRQRDANLMQTILVREAMTPIAAATTMHVNDSIETLTHVFETSGHHGMVVLDDKGELYGIVTLSDLEQALGQKQDLKTVGELATTNVVTIYPDETLDDALSHFGVMDVGRIPVVDRRDTRRVLGLLRRADIVGAYSHALVRSQARETTHERLKLEALAHTEMLQIQLDSSFYAAGKRIGELNLPQDCVIVAVRRGDRTLVPRGNTSLRAGDRLIVLCSPALQPALVRTLQAGETVQPSPVKE